MKVFLTFLASLFLFAGTARADWDHKNWVKLGERDVDGKVDRDVIAVGGYEGRFSKLTLAVEKSDLELLQFEVVFGNNEKWDPNVKQYFKEGARTRVIDLPGDERVIKTINLKYKNFPGGGKAHVEVWGLKDEGHHDHGGGGDMFDNKGWTLLGERAVNGKVDHDRIGVSRHKGKFEKMAIVVLNSDLELLDFDVKFAKGKPWNPALKHSFKEGQRSHIIDFPGDERAIKFIDLKYANTPGGGKAKVQVWAK